MLGLGVTCTLRVLGASSEGLLGGLWLPGLNERSIHFAASMISERSLYSSVFILEMNCDMIN